MLIISQPKTASDSLLHSIKSATNMPGVQDMLLKYRRPKYKRDNIYIWPHSDAAVNINVEKIIEWSRPKVWRKQHLVPSDNNLKILLDNKIKAVIVLRDIEDTIASYDRVFKDYNLKDKGEKYRLAITDFYNKYNALRDIDHFLFIDFEYIINNPAAAINNILEFFDLKIRVDSKFKLTKQHFSNWRKNIGANKNAK